MKPRVWKGLLAAALLVSPCAAQPGAGPSPVVVAATVEELVAPMLTLPGTALPIRRAKVSSISGGVVVERHGYFGQRKKKDDVLVKLDGVKARARADAARAQAAEARARYEMLVAGERAEVIAARRADVARVRSALTNAEKEWDRATNLFSKSAISENEVDQARSRRDAEKANLDAALANLRLAEAGSRREEIAAQKAIAERAEALVLEAGKELEDTVVKAPFDGHVAEVFVEVGDHVAEGGAILELVDLSYLDVVVLVPESRASQIPIGEKAEVDFESKDATVTVTGTIAAIGPQATLKGRTVAVIVRFRNEGEAIRSASSAVVRLPAGRKVPKLVVPKDALVRSAGAPPMVYVVSEGKANPRPVQVGVETRSLVAIESGLKAGELVVTRGNERLMPGAAVKISTAPARP